MLIDKLKKMWDAFLSGIKLAHRELRGKPIDPDIQEYSDISKTNLVSMAISKLSSLTCYKARFKVESDSKLVEPLQNLALDIEDYKSAIFNSMAGDGEYYIFPALDEQGELYHSYLERAFVRLTDIKDNVIQSAYAVLDFYQPNDGVTYFLQRHHELDGSGNLTITYKSVNEQGAQMLTDRWEHLTDKSVTYKGANHIGFGRYKSPVSSRGMSKVYGVPLNFGCSDIERQIKERMAQIEEEFKNGKSVIFTDPRNLLKDKELKQYKIAENIIPIRQRSGESGSNIDIFNPDLRFVPMDGDLNRLYETYERQMGLSKGIFTNNEALLTATATAIKRGNADTLALIDNFHKAMDIGNLMTLEADSIYLGIRKELWTYDSDYFDPFEDPAEQTARLIEAVGMGAACVERLTKYLYPSMTDEQAREEVEKARKERANTDGDAIDALMGE